jgi:hypothetical protein
MRTNYLPLSRPDDRRVRKSRVGFLDFLRQKISDLLESRMSDARLSLESQLRQRDHFPEEEWALEGRSTVDVLPFLLCIRQAMDWPNHNFLPADDLSLLLTDDVYPFGAEECLSQISVLSDGIVDRSFVERMFSEHWTVGQFIETVFTNRQRLR